MKKKELLIVCKVILFQAGVYFGFKILKKAKEVFLRILYKDETISSFVNKMDMYEKWIENIQNTKEMGKFLNNNDVKKIVICVWNKTTELFIKEIADFVNIKYIVDADRDLNQPFNVVDSLDRVDGDDVDLIVVMEPEAYDVFYKEFHTEFKCPIISIDELIEQL